MVKYHSLLCRLPPEVKTLLHLEQLYLSHNQFSVIPQEYEGVLIFLPHSVRVFALVNLKTFWIQDNQLTVIPPDIGNLKLLEKLKLSKNSLRASGNYSLGNG